MNKRWNDDSTKEPIDNIERINHNMGLRRHVYKITELNSQQIDSMFLMMDKYYNNVLKSNFLKDLKEKDFVVMISDEYNHIKGFTTLKLIQLQVDCVPIYGIFSGDTMSDIDDDHFNCSLELAKHWLKFACHLQNQYKDELFYWFLISKGYRTYRLLQYFHKFYPRYDRVTPNFDAKIMLSFGKSYSDKYNPQTGIIHSDGSKDSLRKGVYELGERQLKNPHIRFFLERNPNWNRGDELVCLTRLSYDNLTKAGHRIIKANTIDMPNTIQPINGV